VAHEICLRGGRVVTCDDGHRILRADLLIREGRIERVGRVRSRPACRDLDVSGCLVVPGLVMSHVHLCQTLMRGMADDLPLLEWLQRRIWPLEAAHDAATLRASAELGLAELLRAGATTLLDLGTVHDYDAVLSACLAAGIRVAGGKVLMDLGEGVPRRLREQTRTSLREAELLDATWSNHDSGRIRYAYVPRFILSCSESLVRGAAARAASSGALLHTHAAEHARERDAVRRAHGASDVVVLRRWGFRGRRASIAHGVQLTAGEMRRLARDGVGVVHCPTANLKLGSGLADVAAMRAAGIRVGLGPDGAACNNTLDPWIELRHAGLIAAVRGEPGGLPARDVFELATRGGARLLDLDEQIGSLERGKRADVVVVECDTLHGTPTTDPYAQLVYSTRASDVRHVLIDGELVVEHGELLTLDEARVKAVARQQARRLRRRAGL
jgi:5-methylthioadenosine/S-adenosylhomocysteine deaminase